MDAPAVVIALAAAAGGTPIAWKEYDDHVVICFEDGRKLTFVKEAPEAPRRQTSAADYAEHAGRASELPASVAHFRPKAGGSSDATPTPAGKKASGRKPTKANKD